VDAPNGGRIPARLADSFSIRDSHAGGDAVAQSPEDELAQFLAPLPQWLRKILWHDQSSMTDLELAAWIDSINPFTADELEELKADPGWQPERYPQTADELRPDFEKIVQRCGTAEWKRYRDNARAAHMHLPRGKPGRPRKDGLRNEAKALKDVGLSYAKVATRLNANLSDGDRVTPEAVRKLIKSRPKE
jgi:hypothetical protein